MMKYPITADEVRQAGFEAIYRALGAAGLLRFLLQFQPGHGNYTLERRQWLDQYTLDELIAEAQERQSQKNDQT